MVFLVEYGFFENPGLYLNTGLQIKARVFNKIRIQQGKPGYVGYAQLRFEGVGHFLFDFFDENAVLTILSDLSLIS